MERLPGIVCISIALACSPEDEIRRSSADDFRGTLVHDMTYHDIVKSFGEPDEDRGSGIHIYVYKLSDDE
ncbi:MAG: hypothetical protein WKF87_12805 [Chryseolinea sp.]